MYLLWQVTERSTVGPGNMEDGVPAVMQAVMGRLERSKQGPGQHKEGSLCTGPRWREMGTGSRREGGFLEARVAWRREALSPGAKDGVC